MFLSISHLALTDWDRLHFLLCPSLIAPGLLSRDGEKEIRRLCTREGVGKQERNRERRKYRSPQGGSERNGNGREWLGPSALILPYGGSFGEEQASFGSSQSITTSWTTSETKAILCM